MTRAIQKHIQMECAFNGRKQSQYCVSDIVSLITVSMVDYKRYSSIVEIFVHS